MLICALSFLVAVTTAPRPNPTHSPAHRLKLPQVAAGDLYAARVRRRLASYLRMRLLELRKAGLDRAAGVVERKIPLDKLFEH
jgi:hypothetical protein